MLFIYDFNAKPSTTIFHLCCDVGDKKKNVFCIALGYPEYKYLNHILSHKQIVFVMKLLCAWKNSMYENIF